MPKCKYCNEPITQFDKDICPYCGGKKPIDERIQRTVDITQSIETVGPQDEVKLNFKQKNKVVNAILCMFFGMFAIDDLYIGYNVRFLLRFIINAVAYVGLCLIFTIDKLNIERPWMFVLPILILFVIYFVVGIIFLFIKNRKDANGVFLV